VCLAEESAKILGDARGEGFDGFVQKCGDCLVVARQGGEVGSEACGCVGLDEEPVARCGAKGGEEACAAWVEEACAEGEIRAEGGESGEHLGGAGVAVEEEARARGRKAAQGFEEEAVSLYAVERGDAIELGGEGELRVEGGELRGDWGRAGAAEEGAVEADLADLGAGIGEEAGAELREPVIGRGGDIPRVQAVTRDDRGRAVVRGGVGWRRSGGVGRGVRLVARGGEGGDLGPVVGVRAVEERSGGGRAGFAVACGAVGMCVVEEHVEGNGARGRVRSD